MQKKQMPALIVSIIIKTIQGLVLTLLGIALFAGIPFTFIVLQSCALLGIKPDSNTLWGITIGAGSGLCIALLTIRSQSRKLAQPMTKIEAPVSQTELRKSSQSDVVIHFLRILIAGIGAGLTAGLVGYWIWPFFKRGAVVSNIQGPFWITSPGTYLAVLAAAITCAFVAHQYNQQGTNISEDGSER